MTTLARVLIFAGLPCLALITLATPGATRMWATPWTLALWGALLLPTLALMLRAFDARLPLALPSRAWLGGALACAGVAIVSALASPYRDISLRWSAPLLGGVALFFVAFDGLHAAGPQAENRARRDRWANAALLAALVAGATSMGLWGNIVAHAGWRAAIAARNPFPLGHSNYAAGLAVLMLPLAAHATWRRRGFWRLVAALTLALALAMIFSSGSRGGLIGLAALAATTLLCAPFPRKTKLLLALGAGAAGLAFIVANPRTRATFTGGAERHLVAASTTQRSAMFSAGVSMGTDRPLLGWGPGTTPLVYPRYRARLEGGAENVLQLHCTPVQLWAELGLAGIACFVGFGFLVVRHRQRAPLAALTLAGYAAFALTDWQLDIPIFAAAIACNAALLAPACDPAQQKRRQRAARLGIGLAAIVAIALVAVFGRIDPAPVLNSRALALATDKANADRAIALLRESLALNPEQEIAHFNLGWLLVVRDPVAAGSHFRSAARLVPDKGGVYFGLGLALLNTGNRDAAAHAFALECLNDPAFLFSPWWREASLMSLRAASAAAFAEYLSRLERAVTRPANLTPDLLGRVPTGPERNYRRERSGYPVLMRNLDLPPPQDLFDVREAVAVDPALRELPTKGWLPSPLLIELLDDIAPSAPKSRAEIRP